VLDISERSLLRDDEAEVAFEFGFSFWSLKNSCLRAYSAVIRLSGSYISNFSIKSTASFGVPGSNLDMIP
jgi:hypothetical protein